MSRLKPFPLGSGTCSRCGGHDPNCCVCQEIAADEDEDDGPEAELEHEQYLADCMRDDQWEAEQEANRK